MKDILLGVERLEINSRVGDVGGRVEREKGEMYDWSGEKEMS